MLEYVGIRVGLCLLMVVILLIVLGMDKLDLSNNWNLAAVWAIIISFLAVILALSISGLFKAIGGL